MSTAVIPILAGSTFTSISVMIFLKDSRSRRGPNEADQ